ncbi:MAG TPA: type IV secretory system conjugative DNA transfer family protein [Acidimicrobiales bacterium]|nr:type IV secretory system conjugative DNA transfer family protein [Acidimicrobiales bacterium]
MSEDDRARRALERRQQDWRRELNRMASASKRQLEDQRRRARWDLERQVSNAKNSLKPPSSRGGGSAKAPGTPELDDLAGRIAIGVAAVAFVVLAVGHVTAVLTAGEWPRYQMRDVPGIVGRLATDPGDPTGAWEPVNTGGAVPGPVAFWSVLLLLLVLVGALALVMTTRTVRASRPAGGWATRGETRRLRTSRLRTRRGAPHRLVLGTAGRDVIAVRDHHSVLVVGPAFAGKTAGVTIPALLEWPGPAVVVSTKGHLIDQTIGWRSQLGEVHVFDPAATTSYPRSGWSLLADCATWPGAIRTARDLTVAAKASIGTRVDAADLDDIGGDALWSSSMAMTLAPYLYAAVISGRSIEGAANWIAHEDRDEVLTVLRPVSATAARVHENTFARADPMRSAYLHLMHRILTVYDDPVVAASMDRHEIIPEELLDGGDNTLYLTAPEHDQARFRPLSSAILRQVLATAYDRSAARAGPLGRPLLLLLDQVVGIAPVDDLAAVASTGAARGVQVVSVFKDLAQVDGHYGAKSRLLVNNHPAKLVLPGAPELTRDSTGIRLLPDELADDLSEGEAALLYGNRRPMRLRLRPWYKVRELRRRRETPMDAWDPADHGHDAPRYVPREQVGVWLRRGSGRSDQPANLGWPADHDAPEFTSVFGNMHEDDTAPINVTSLSDARNNPFRTL